jgi:pyridoxine 5-phosphate synthase
MIRLGVNLDHVATLRQARYRTGGGAGASPEEHGEPDPVRALHEAELGGADCITVHLREDRRHIVDREVEAMRPLSRVKFNLEMAPTDAMVALAIRLRPHMATLVPEGRMEVTTEGGLNVRAQPDRFKGVVARLRDAGIMASAFIDADLAQIDASAAAGFTACELHTGPYALAYAQAGGSFRDPHLLVAYDALASAGRRVVEGGLQFNAGHALNYQNVQPVAMLDRIEELHIGHSIIARAVFTGLRTAVADMKLLLLDAVKLRGIKSHV